MHGVAVSLMAALALLMAFGIRYPLQMLPIMLFELRRKAMWVAAIGLPLWSAHQLTPDLADTFKACVIGGHSAPLIGPWPYIWAKYVKTSGDRWQGASAVA